MGTTQSSALAGAFSDKGPARPANQDAYWIPTADTPVQFGRLYLVADGVGGLQDGAVASQLAVETIRKVFYSARQNGKPVSEALVAAIEAGNTAVYREAQEHGKRMGSTLVAAVYDNADTLNLLHIAHVGDARAYLARAKSLQRLTRDDTWVQRQVDAGLLTDDQAANHELRHVVTQVLGNKPEVQVHLVPDFSLDPGEVVLLCSDGLYDVVSEEQLHRILLSHPPSEAAPLLVQEAINANAGDNITAVVLQAAHSSLPVAADPDATLAATPVQADEPTLTPLALADARPVPPPAASEPARKFPMWLLLTLISVIALLFVVGIFIWRSMRQNVAITPEMNVPLLLSTEEASATVPSLPTVTPTMPPTFTPLPALLPTPAVSTTLTATLESEQSNGTLPVGATAASLACVNSTNATLFVWSDTQISVEPCTIGQFAQEGFLLSPGQQVEVLSEEVRTVNGPDASCQANEFIRVRSVDDPEVEGWVLNSGLRRIEAGEACGP